MKRKFTSMIGVMMACIMATGMITGCGNVQGSKTSESGKQNVANSEENGTQVSEEITYPLSGNIKLSLYTPIAYLQSDYLTPEESPFLSGLEKNTGVDIEWQFLAQGADKTTSYNLLLQDEELPNIIFSDILKVKEGIRLLNDGLIYDLTDYLPKYAPDYWAYITAPENKEILKQLTTEDGRFWGVASFRESDYNVTYMGPMIRQDWLDECGLETPVTLEDWENVLTVFKDKYNANFGSPMKDLIQCGIASGTGAFGGLQTYYYVDENNKVQLGMAQEEWKEQMEVLHRWYEKGLLDRDFATADRTVVRSKVLNNEFGIVFTAMSQLSLYVGDANKENTGAKWVGLSYPRTEEGATLSFIQTSRTTCTGNSNAVITTDCTEEELIQALKFLNYGYTEEGIMYWNYGEEGVSYTLDKDGKPQWTDKVVNDPAGQAEGLKRYTGVSSCGPTIQTERFVQIKNTKEAEEAVYKWIENSEAPKYALPALSFTEDENERYADISSSMDTYINTMALKFITGEESLDNFDDFVKELNKLGLEEILEIQQNAFDRYLAK